MILVARWRVLAVHQVAVAKRRVVQSYIIHPDQMSIGHKNLHCYKDAPQNITPRWPQQIRTYRISSLKLLQETKVVAGEEANLADGIFDHGDTLWPHAEG